MFSVYNQSHSKKNENAVKRTERFIDGQVCLDDKHWCANDLSLLYYVTSSSVQNTVYTTDCCLGTLLQTTARHVRFRYALEMCYLNCR